MHKILLITAAMLTSFFSFGQKKDVNTGLKFKDITDIEVTTMKDQASSGTCWCFSGLSFLEAELIRMGRGAHDLSEMWLVKKSYHEKALDYVRYHKEMSFSQGGESNDVMDMISIHGIVPEDLFKGLNYGEKRHRHSEMETVLKNMLDGVVMNKNKKLSTAWLRAFDSVLDAYMGEDIETFEIDGREYTPQTYRDELGIVPDNYIEIGSFSHHPFYSNFVIELPDNWSHGRIYNIPLDEFTEVLDQALEAGYTALWGSDVSEEGFNSRAGYAILPSEEKKEMSDAEISKWEKMSEEKNDPSLFVNEKEVTQESRQEGFDNYQTEDDHGMHITGIAQDQFGRKFYKVKNSWGKYNKFGGYFYASEAFVKAKSMTIMIHKDAIPGSIKTKLGIK